MKCSTNLLKIEIVIVRIININLYSRGSSVVERMPGTSGLYLAIDNEKSGEIGEGLKIE